LNLLAGTLSFDPVSLNDLFGVAVPVRIKDTIVGWNDTFAQTAGIGDFDNICESIAARIWPGRRHLWRFSHDSRGLNGWPSA
jgi:hypothetical protein